MVQARPNLLYMEIGKDHVPVTGLMSNFSPMPLMALPLAA